MSKTFHVTQEAPANALALNKEFSHVVIAGRSVFKIFQIKDEEFTEVCNLRVGKNLNLNFSCNDVAWNALEDHVLATAATNGAVVVWNLNRPSRSKQENVFNDHDRTVNKVSFNPVEASWLISGSQDGTMRTFDIRTRVATNIFYSNTESVRDVQFSPHSHVQFASVSENGNVQTWDMRKGDKCVLQFTAHSGPIFACDWHPDCAWLATASRDKTIKVWDMSGKPSLEQTINTIASVGRVKWRPQHKYQLASVALVVDCSVNVWDVRRPYIPFAAFVAHKDVATGIAWRGDPNICLTTSRDCTLYQHVFKDAIYPAAQANPQALDISPQGLLAFACRSSLLSTKCNQNSSSSTSTAAATTAKIQGILRRGNNSNDDFIQETSALSVMSIDINKESDWLLACAHRYVLTGPPLAEICDHNAAVARSLGRLAVSILWGTIKTLYTSKSGLEYTGSSSYQQQVSVPRGEDLTDGINGATGSGESKTLNIPPLKENGLSVENDASLTPVLGDSVGDFFFGDSEMDPLSMEFEINGLDGLISQDWSLQMEAFPLRHEIQDRSPPPEQFPNNNESPDLEENGDIGVGGGKVGLCALVAQIESPADWDERETVAAALCAHGQAGDVQTPVCVLTALGSRRASLLSFIDPFEQETWFFSYLSLLSQHMLFVHSNEIIKLCWLPSVNQLNQQSTTIHIGCAECGRSLPPGGGGVCSKCSTNSSKPSTTPLCSVCHSTVLGPYTWCQGCMHGGHLFHILNWVSNNTLCPSGCGHACEYT